MCMHLFVCADSPLWRYCHLSWAGFADPRLVITSLRWAINHLTVTFQFSCSLNSPENPHFAARRRCEGDVQSPWLSLIWGGVSKQGWPISSSVILTDDDYGLSASKSFVSVLRTVLLQTISPYSYSNVRLQDRQWHAIHSQQLTAGRVRSCQ